MSWGVGVSKMSGCWGVGGWSVGVLKMLRLFEGSGVEGVGGVGVLKMLRCCGHWSCWSCWGASGG